MPTPIAISKSSHTASSLSVVQEAPTFSKREFVKKINTVFKSNKKFNETKSYQRAGNAAIFSAVACLTVVATPIIVSGAVLGGMVFLGSKAAKQLWNGGAIYRGLKANFAGNNDRQKIKVLRRQYDALRHLVNLYNSYPEDKNNTHDGDKRSVIISNIRNKANELNESIQVLEGDHRKQVKALVYSKLIDLVSKELPNIKNFKSNSDEKEKGERGFWDSYNEKLFKKVKRSSGKFDRHAIVTNALKTFYAKVKDYHMCDLTTTTEMERAFIKPILKSAVPLLQNYLAKNNFDAEKFSKHLDMLIDHVSFSPNVDKALDGCGNLLKVVKEITKGFDDDSHPTPETNKKSEDYDHKVDTHFGKSTSAEDLLNSPNLKEVTEVPMTPAPTISIATGKSTSDADILTSLIAKEVTEIPMPPPPLLV